MSGIRVTVGAAADASLDRAFIPLINAAAKAKARVIKDALDMQKQVERAHARAADSAARQAARAAGQVQAMAAKQAAAEIASADRVAQAKVKAEQRAFDQKLRLVQRQNREIERANSRAQSSIIRDNRADEKRAAGQRGTRAERLQEFGSNAARNLAGVARAGVGVARDVARGAGVQFDLSSLVGKSVALETAATNVSNSAYQPGSGQGRVDPKDLVAQARQIGNMAAFDPEQIMEGLTAFVGKTGDLKTGRDTLADLAKLSRATGTGLEDMVDAAGDVAIQLGDVSDKGPKIAAIMRTIAGQGKVGAVEIRDLAVQMAKLGAAASAFEGDPKKNIELMGAFAQSARQKGGAASATQAATSVAALINTFKTPARTAAFESATGKKVFNEKTGMLRDPKQLVMEALAATQGDPEKFKKIFANVQGARAVEGFATTFRQARSQAMDRGVTGDGAVKAGLDAVEQEFKKFSKPIGEDEQGGAFQKSMETSAARVQLFNNKIAEIGASVAERVLPQLEKLAPAIINAVDAMAKLIGWAAENPSKAITLAIVGSIAKAAIGSAVSGALTDLMKNAVTSGAGLAGKALSGGAGAAGAIGLTLAIAAATIVIGSAIIDMVSNDTQKGVNQSVNADAETVNAIAAYNGAVRTGGTADPVVRSDLESVQAQLQARIAAAQDPTSALGAIFTSKTFEDRGKEQNDAANILQLKSDLAQVTQAINMLSGKLTGGIPVTVSNMPSPVGAGVDSAGRTGSTAAAK
jgi:hypothetical protein